MKSSPAIRVNDKTMLVVGVAKDSKYFTLGENQKLALYEPYFASDEPLNPHFIVRSAGFAVRIREAHNGLIGTPRFRSGHRNENND